MGYRFYRISVQVMEKLVNPVSHGNFRLPNRIWSGVGRSTIYQECPRWIMTKISRFPNRSRTNPHDWGFISLKQKGCDCELVHRAEVLIIPQKCFADQFRSGH
jgi:hypothetical protein